MVVKSPKKILSFEIIISLEMVQEGNSPIYGHDLVVVMGVDSGSIFVAVPYNWTIFVVEKGMRKKSGGSCYSSLGCVGCVTPELCLDLLMILLIQLF